MAQLRDAITSALIAEGTPEAMVLLAEELGRADVIFDGVASERAPDAFDPDAVLQAHRDNAAGLEAAAEAESDPDAKASLQEAAQRAAAIETQAAAMAPDAREAMEAARALADV
jgi:hypothetical protein